jgi:hypothetical protein
MPGRFAPMALELETERLNLRLWEESDADWHRQLVGERGAGMPTPEAARGRTTRAKSSGASASCRERGLGLARMGRGATTFWWPPFRKQGSFRER